MKQTPFQEKLTVCAAIAALGLSVIGVKVSMAAPKPEKDSDITVIMKKALEEEATSIVLCHNHPSGNLRPSQADEELTKKIKGAAAYFDIKVIDHIIVSEEGFYSFADEGIL